MIPKSKRPQIIAKAAKNINKAGLARKAGTKVMLASIPGMLGGVVLFPSKGGLSLWAGSLAVGEIGRHASRKGMIAEERMLARCVGKPHLAAELAPKIKDPYLRRTFENVSRMKGLSRTQKEALVNYFTKKADVTDANIAKRLLEIADKKT